jgi:lipid-binding SYLF domain-containing protein
MQSLRIAAVLAVAMIALSVRPALADDSIEADANAALQKLYADTPAAKMIGDKAKAVLVFPNIVKAGFIVGAHYGEGVLLMNGKLVAHYNSVAGSYGLQAGVKRSGMRCS